MPATNDVTEEEEMKEALEKYLKENKDIADALEVMKQASDVRNRGRFSVDSPPYRSLE
jgi:tRNA A-37 threonylcarbamoyl transferase component Bud32